ncbi:MAG: transglutaminase domain-containing protein [Lentisphaerae bacterium]|nr:transglutaminase domain-containing protein [Lentisphaerota bacterium]
MNRIPAGSRVLALALLGLLPLGTGSLPRAGAATNEASAKRYELGPVTNIVTGDIKAGIEKHISAEVVRGDGVMKLPFNGKELELELVRVHVEYLATLGPGRHFACVDMAGADGAFYDVDFFMEGDPGFMRVTETTVHKVDGVPLYLWKQAPDKSWGRAPADAESKELLGVLQGKDTFEFRYQATLPVLPGEARLWLPLAQSDDFQKVEVVSVTSPVPSRVLTESAYGNKALFMTVGPEQSGKTVEVAYRVERREKGPYAGDAEEARRYLTPESRVPLTDAIRSAAASMVERKQGDLMRARAIYDRTIDDLRYRKCGEGWGEGDAVYACSARAGNCTDYHAYFIAHARAAGIPARFAIGAAIPSERGDGGTDGYHCWAEFYADGKWYPVDISEADKFSSLSMYYFGHHPANRFEFTRGRDLVFEPGPLSGPINFFAYPVLELDGKPVKVQTLFAFRRLPAPGN